MKYGPKMTSKIKKELEREIAAFNEAKTKHIIEEKAVGKPDINAYWNYVSEHGEGLRDNPDLLCEEDAIQFNRFKSTPEIEQAKEDIYHLFSPREKQVWRYIMRDGLSERQTAEQLNISEITVHEYIIKAKKKVEKHFNGK